MFPCGHFIFSIVAFITMVLIHHKRNDENQFLYQTTCDAQTDQVIADLVTIHNFKLRLKRLAGHIEELSKYG